MELHDGTLNVTSTVGRGSIFTITLPVINTEGKEKVEAEPDIDYEINPSLLTGLTKKEGRDFSSPKTVSGTEESTQKEIPATRAQVNAPGRRTRGELFITTDKHRLCTDSEYDRSKKNIFLIEDNEELLFYMKENLDSHYNVFISQDGRNALEKIKKLPELPDLIISDIMMPVMDGWMFYQNLIKKKEYLHIPFIFLTSKMDEKLKGLSLGAVDYICKPFFMDEVIYKIETLLRLCEYQERKNAEELRAKILSVLQQKTPENISLFNEKCKQYHIIVREKEIIQLVRRGYIDKEIAYELNIFPNTVNTHLKNIYKKSDTNHRIELVNKLTGI